MIASAAAVPAPESRTTGEIRVNDFTTGSQVPYSMAMNAGGDFIVGWGSDGQDGDDIGAFARRYDARGRPLTGEIQANVNTAGAQFHSMVGLAPDGHFVVVWNSVTPGAGVIDIYARLFASDGTPLTGEIPVNTFTPGPQIGLGTDMNASGEFVVLWTSEQPQDGSTLGAFARRFDAAGAPLTGEILLNSTTSGRQQPSPNGVAMDDSGAFVAVWGSVGQDGDDLGLYARRFSPSGTPLTPEIPVNTTTSGGQESFGIAAARNGNFVVSWMSDDQDGSVTGAYARIFDGGGNPVTGELQVNQTTADFQRTATPAMDADGDILITWRSQGQDGDLLAAYGRRFDASGHPVTDEFRINDYTTGNQFPVPSAMDADGDYVVVWASARQDGNNSGVFLRRYAGPEDVDLAVLVQAPGSVPPGGSGAFLVRARNDHAASAEPGVGLATGTSVMIEGDASTQIVGASGAGWTCQGAGPVSCERADGLAPGATSAPLTVTVAPVGAATQVSISAEVSGDQFDATPADDVASASAPVAFDTTPNPFVLEDVEGVATYTDVISNAIAVSGIDAGAQVSIAGGSYSINGGAFSTTTGTAVAGDSVRVRVRSSPSPNTTRQGLLTIGGQSEAFRVTTGATDTTPDAYTLIDQADVPPGSLRVSDPITVSGINAPALIAVVNGEYRVNNGGWMTAAGSVQAGDSVVVRHRASFKASTSVNTRLTVGTVFDTFTSTTAAGDIDPDPLTFPTLINQPVSTLVESAALVPTGYTSPSPVRALSGTEYSIDGAPYTSAIGVISPGQSLRLRHVTAATPATQRATAVSIGSVSGVFRTRTAP